MEQVRNKAKQDFVRVDRTKAPPDGYTVGLGGIAQNVLRNGSYAKLPYDPRGDFTFIGGIWQLPNILPARRDLFSSDLKELLAAFKKGAAQIHLRTGGIRHHAAPLGRDDEQHGWGGGDSHGPP
jgi:tripartite-type tricarboxylate transporter receptor subunit TctC